MKKIKKRTLIAIGCVALAIASSQMYRTLKRKEPPENEVAVISEILPSIPPPIATPEIKESLSTLPETVQTTPISELTVPVNTQKNNNSFLLPASGEVLQAFSDTELIFFENLNEWRCHLGIDFLPSENDAVFAVADGTVEKIYEDHLFGTTIVIDHENGLKSFYASLSDTTVSAGVNVISGTEIGKMGETAQAEKGIHLHFSMEKEGCPIDPFGEK